MTFLRTLALAAARDLPAALVRWNVEREVVPTAAGGVASSHRTVAGAPEPEGRRRRSAVAAGRFLLVLAGVAAFKRDALFDPPVWDAAMGLFPAALTLAANGFDLLEVLAMPGYLEGGPDAHATSPVTLVTALVLMASGGGTRGFVLLHLLHFAAAAWALLLLFRLARPVLSTDAALLLCLAVLLHPTVSAQVGSMYLELPLALAAVAAVLAWYEGRPGRAVLWGGVAFAIKESGAIVPGALAVLALLEARPLRERAARAALPLAPVAAWTAAVAALHRWANGGPGGYEIVPRFDAVFGGLGHYLGRFLLNVPDLLVWFLVFFAAAAAAAGPVIRALRREPTPPAARSPEREEAFVLGATGAVLALFVMLFMVALPALAGFTIVLPRYYVPVLPFLLLWVGWAVKRTLGRRSRRAPALALGLLAMLFAVNGGGVLYPLDVNTEGPGNDPALTERSNAYRRLLALQREAMRALEALPDDAPVYYGHYEHYLLAYPGLGYADGPLPNGHNFAVESLAPLATAEPFPPCAYALFSYPWLGGEKVLGLIRLPELRPDVEAEIVRELRDGRYAILLVRIGRRGADCSP